MKIQKCLITKTELCKAVEMLLIKNRAYQFRLSPWKNPTALTVMTTR